MGIEPQLKPGDLSPVKRALKAVEAMQAKLDAMERAGREGIAIIGMGCRLPGGIYDADSFWHVLENGIDTIREVPRDRWDLSRYFDADSAAPGKMYTRYGGFVEAIDQFDTSFFNISPKEARSLDPQQRLLLETAWEALENAGIAPLSIREKLAGVFVGLCSNDYAQLLAQREESEIDAYLAVGTTHSMAAGRLSYLLGLNGPNLAVDTACSSGLAAVHLAIQSLRSRESDIALAGAANCILTPHYSINFCKARMLAPDGRCKTFADGADGFVRGEGAGVVVLKRLSDARRDGDRVLAVIRGSAMNQDGHTSGPTVPSGPAQQAVIRRALDNAGVKPEDISFVEAHGTATALGDPIEAGALGAVFHHPLWVGSVKTNIGHLEGAAGIAGLLKVVLALQNRRIPANLHFDKPSAHIAWSDLLLRVPVTTRSWDAEALRTAGISSFGFSGTNVHVIVQEAEDVAATPATQPEREWHVVTLSARSDVALKETAIRILPFVEADLPNTAFTLNTGRFAFEYRLALVARDGQEVSAQLRKYLSTGGAEGVKTGVVPEGVECPVVTASDWTAHRLQDLFVGGASIDWAAWDRGFLRRKLALPSYPFQRRRHWYREEEKQAEEELIYEVQWQPRDIPQLPTPATLAASLPAAPVATRNDALESIERLSAQYAVRALADLEGKHSRVTASRRRLFDRLLETQVFAESISPEEQLATLHAAHPEAEAELQLIARCGNRLAAILTGDCDPLTILQPTDGGGLDKIYRYSPSSRGANLLAREAMARIVAQWPTNRPLRILEAGAGTGGTTAHLLDVLPADRTEYVFTDVSRSFLRDARERFAGVPFLHCEILDIEKDELQGVAAGSYDVVVAANVLHATKDLSASLRHLRKLLVPGGLLLLLEVTHAQRWLDITFGLLDGWWRFTDTDLRRNHPLLAAHQWQALLETTGFSETASVAVRQDGALLQQSMLLARVAYPDALTWTATEKNPEAACFDLLSLAQQVLREQPSRPRRIWAAVRDTGDTAQASVAALGRVISLEHPEIWGGIVHVPSRATAKEITSFVNTAAELGEKEFAFRDGQVFAPRLVRKSLPDSAPCYRFRADGTYLITGFGFLGLRLAKWMVSQGARNLALLSRSGASSPEAVASLAVLSDRGVHIAVLQGDVSDPTVVRRIIDHIGVSLPTLRGIVHAAGCGVMEPMASVTREHLRQEFAPKHTGACALHEATLGLPLDFFVLFSSASSVWGAKGQAQYAAANACLDALAAQRRQMNLPALSVNWGLLSGGGMISPEYRAWLTRAGIEPLEPEDGFRSLFRCVMQPVSQAVIARIDWQKFAEVYEAREHTSLFDQMKGESKPTVAEDAPCFRDMPEEDRPSALREFVLQQFCLALGLAPEDAPDPRRGFFDAGMDSLLAIEFKNLLERSCGVTLPSTVAFNYPNAESLAAFLDRQLSLGAKPSPEPAVAATFPESTTNIDGDIARLFRGVEEFLREEHA